jgi:hypothetical protein
VNLPASSDLTGRADHQPYIEAVHAALAAKDIHVGDVTYSRPTVRMRSATLHLVPPPEGDPEAEPWHGTFTDALEVLACWTEKSGWFLVAPSIRHGNRVASPWPMGLCVLPTPQEVADWLDLLLTTAVAASQEHRPYRSVLIADPAFERSLTAYAATSPQPPG